MPHPLPTDSYLFAKLDKQFRHLYINELYQSLFKISSEALLGRSLQDIKPRAMPQCVLQDALERVSQKGYAYAPVPHEGPSGDIFWGFVDLTRRFGAAADSGMIGYEFVSYPASVALIDFFGPLYEDVIQQELKAPQTALEYFYQSIAETGKSYDELVHTLQNA